MQNDFPTRRQIEIFAIAMIALLLIGFVTFIWNFQRSIQASTIPVIRKSNSSQSFGEKSSVLDRHASFLLLTPVEDIEYRLVTYSGGIGPSSTESLVALKIKQEYIEKWLKGYEQHDDCMSVEQKLPSLNLSWILKSQPEFYIDQSSHEIMLYRKEGVMILYDMN